MQHEWLVAHNLIKSEAQKQREEYVRLMKDYFYDVNTYVWDSWSDSQLRDWLVDHDVLKSNAELRREKVCLSNCRDPWNLLVVDGQDGKRGCSSERDCHKV